MKKLIKLTALLLTALLIMPGIALSLNAPDKEASSEKITHAKKRLLQALDNRDIEELKAIIAEGIIDIKNFREEIPDLHGGDDLEYWSLLAYLSATYTSQEEDKEIATILKEAGDDVNARLTHNKTPLHVAAEHKNVPMVEFLIENGADVNAKMNGDVTPLHLAYDMLEYYRRKGDKRPDKIIKLLLEAGADPKAKTTRGKLPGQYEVAHCR